MCQNSEVFFPPPPQSQPKLSANFTSFIQFLSLNYDYSRLSGNSEKLFEYYSPILKRYGKKKQKFCKSNWNWTLLLTEKI